MNLNASVSNGTYSEESKPDSDLDEPWIMTVKGMHFNNFTKQGAAITSGDDSQLSTSPYKHNGSSNNSSNRDSNSNHYKSNQVRTIYYINRIHSIQHSFHFTDKAFLNVNRTRVGRTGTGCG